MKVIPKEIIIPEILNNLQNAYAIANQAEHEVKISTMCVLNEHNT